MGFLDEMAAVDEAIFGSLGDEWLIDGILTRAITNSDDIAHPAGWGRRMHLIIEKRFDYRAEIGVPVTRDGEEWIVADKTPPVDGLVTLILEVKENGEAGSYP